MDECVTFDADVLYFDAPVACIFRQSPKRDSVEQRMWVLLGVGHENPVNLCVQAARLLNLTV